MQKARSDQETRAGHSMTFTAMASPCTVLIDTDDERLARSIGGIVEAEARRIEEKFSRYRPSVVTTINQRSGLPTTVDEETADLIDYGVRCYELSEGRFDLTSGALRRVWTFAQGSICPSVEQVNEVLQVVGWQRVRWARPCLTLSPGMELDFGGIGKEYAVDRAVTLATRCTREPILVNLGGDLRISGPRRDGSAWRVAIEDVRRAGDAGGMLDLVRGAIATSGDTHRRVLYDGVRFGHVLNPLTGWPVSDSPRSVTVHADTCSEAGLLAKLGLLQGIAAEAFLEAEHVRAWCVR